jgi:hypothetical protein
MKKSELINDLKEYIGKSANKKIPNTTANAIYFIFKQYSVSIDNKRSYSNILKEIKKCLSVDFGWSMVEIHACFCKLSELLKY